MSEAIKRAIQLLSGGYIQAADEVLREALDDRPLEWVGLSEDEIESEADEATDYYTFKAAVRWAGQRLKERNT